MLINLAKHQVDKGAMPNGWSWWRVVLLTIILFGGFFDHEAYAVSLAEISADTRICWNSAAEVGLVPAPHYQRGGWCEVYASCNEIAAQTNGFKSSLQYQVNGRRSTIYVDLSDCSDFNGTSSSIDTSNRSSITTEYCEDFDTNRLSQVARTFFSIGCRNRFLYTLESRYPHKDLAYFLKDEDGVTPLIRTGYETELYRHLKHRLLNKEAFPERLPMPDLFMEAIFAISSQVRGGDDSQILEVNIVDVFLTAHNVARLLARPEQWWGAFPSTPAGQNRLKDDAAHAIYLDILGDRSVDFYPSLKQYFRWRNFDPLKLTEVFFGGPGVFQYFAEVNGARDTFPPSHINAGIHYYFWIGALGRWLGDSITYGTYGAVGTEAAGIYEYLQKGLAQYDRASLQIGIGFDGGSYQSRKLFEALHEIKEKYPAMIR